MPVERKRKRSALPPASAQPGAPVRTFAATILALVTGSADALFGGLKALSEWSPAAWKALAKFVAIAGGLSFVIDYEVRQSYPTLRIGEGLVQAGRRSWAAVTFTEWCQDQIQGRFDQDTIDFRDAGWRLELDRFGDWSVLPVTDAKPELASGAALVLKRDPDLQSGRERFMFPMTDGKPAPSDFPRIQFEIPPEWLDAKIRLRASLRWENVVWMPDAFPRQVSVNYKYTMKHQDGFKSDYKRLLQEAPKEKAWHQIDETVTFDRGTSSAVLRVGLHGVYGTLHIDNVRLTVCR